MSRYNDAGGWAGLYLSPMSMLVDCPISSRDSVQPNAHVFLKNIHHCQVGLYRREQKAMLLQLLEKWETIIGAQANEWDIKLGVMRWI